MWIWLGMDYEVLYIFIYLECSLENVNNWLPSVFTLNSILLTKWSPCFLPELTDIILQYVHYLILFSHLRTDKYSQKKMSMIVTLFCSTANRSRPMWRSTEKRKSGSYTLKLTSKVVSLYIKCVIRAHTFSISLLFIDR